MYSRYVQAICPVQLFILHADMHAIHSHLHGLLLATTT